MFRCCQHAGTVERGATQLFPEIEPDARGFFSGVLSKFFNDYFRAVGVKVDRRVNFHSFRHGIADAFRNAGYYDEQFNVLLGHTKATTTGIYGNVPQGILSHKIREAMKAAWGTWQCPGARKQLRFKTLYSDDWATYCMRNQRKVAKIIGQRTFTITRPLTREAQWAYGEVRRILRGR